MTVNQNGDAYPDGVVQETFNPGPPVVWNYHYFQGTSMASPHVAGAATLLRGCVPEANRDAIRFALQESAEDLGAAGYDTSYGHGLLQIDDALNLLATAYGRNPNNCAQVTAPICYTISATADGPGQVTVSPPPNCDPDGMSPYNYTGYKYATELTVTAAPNAGSQFEGWSGDLNGSTPEGTLYATRNLSVTGAFSLLPPEPQVYLSYKGNVKMSGATYADEDVLLDAPSAPLSLSFDGSAHGLSKADVDAFALLPDGNVLLSIDGTAKNLPGMGSATVDDSDIVRFNPTTRQYAWYFDGSDMELTTAAEDIDALAVLPDGRLLISTVGAAKTQWVNGAGDDILVYEGTVDSDVTEGTLALYFDGSDLAKKLKKIGSIAYRPGGTLGYLYLVSETNVTIGGLTVTKGDVFRCEISSLGANSACQTLDFLWRGVNNGFPAKAALDAVEVVYP